MEENKNIAEEVIPAAVETVIETPAVVEETAVVAEEAVVEETVIEETPVVAEEAVVEETVVAEAPAVEEIVIEEAPAAKVKAPKPVPAGDFDWDTYENGITMSPASKADLELIYDNTLN